jgi:ribosomal protein L31E
MPNYYYGDGRKRDKPTDEMVSRWQLKPSLASQSQTDFYITEPLREGDRVLLTVRAKYPNHAKEEVIKVLHKHDASSGRLKIDGNYFTFTAWFPNSESAQLAVEALKEFLPKRMSTQKF